MIVSRPVSFPELVPNVSTSIPRVVEHARVAMTKWWWVLWILRQMLAASEAAMIEEGCELPLSHRWYRVKCMPTVVVKEQQQCPQELPRSCISMRRLRVSTIDVKSALIVR